MIKQYNAGDIITHKNLIGYSPHNYLEYSDVNVEVLRNFLEEFECEIYLDTCPSIHDNIYNYEIYTSIVTIPQHKFNTDSIVAYLSRFGYDESKTPHSELIEDNCSYTLELIFNMICDNTFIEDGKYIFNLISY